MHMTRRRFTQGLAAVAGAPGVKPAAALPGEAGFEDAYERLLGEYFRVEEVALASGTPAPSDGPLSWQGRHLEDFIARLDRRVDLPTTARQVYEEFRTAARKRIDEEAERIKTALRDQAAPSDPDLDAAEETPVSAERDDEASAPRYLGKSRSSSERTSVDVSNARIVSRAVAQKISLK